MNTGLQVKIDRYVGRVACILLRMLVQVTGKLLRIDHKLDRNFDRIVVCKFKGMGSIVQASAMLEALKKQFPQSELVFVSTKANAGILNAYPQLIDRQLLLNDSGVLSLLKSIVHLLWKLWRFRPQVYIDLEVYSNFSSLICTLSAATNRIGFYKSDKDYRSGLYTHLMYYNIKAPLKQIYLQMARLTGEISEDVRLVKPAYNRENALAELEAAGLTTKRYWVVNPNASDLRLERRWGAEQFVALVDALLDEQSALQVVFCGSPSERAYVSSIEMQCKNRTRIVNLAGKTGFNALLCLIDNAERVITNDTGPLHLSLAFDKDVIGLFGPCSPAQYGQMERCTAVYRNVYCSPCVHEFAIPPCRGNNQCMKQIALAEVLGAVEASINYTAALKETAIAYSISQETLGFVNNRT
jgi:ADP-heptose:LPS heptosyltransferase